MKRITAFVLVVLILLLCANAFAANGLKWRQYWLELLGPVQKYDFDKYLSLLDEFHSEHPKLMNDDAYSTLQELGEKCGSINTKFVRDEDPFTQSFKLMPLSLTEVGENEQIVPYMDGTKASFSMVTIAPKWWLTATKAIFLSDAGDKVYVTLRPTERILGYTENGDYMETYTDSFGYSLTSWEKLLTNDQMTSIQVRYYGEDEKTYDYLLTEDEVQAFRDVLSISSAQKQLSDALQEWCKSIETVDE